MSDLLIDALDRWEGWELGDPFDPGTLDVILDAARRVAKPSAADVLLWMGWEECGTCDGEGWEPVPDEDRSDRSTIPCPDCVGGLVPPASQVEAAAKVAEAALLAQGFVWDSHAFGISFRAGLLAMARTLEEK